MLQFITQLYDSYFSDLLKITQFAAAILSLFVFLKLRKIEKKYLFKSSSKIFSNKIQTLATELKNNIKNSNELYRILAEIESTLTSIDRLQISDLKPDIKKCKSHLKKSYKKYLYFFNTSERKLPIKRDIWRLHGDLHGLATSINDIKHENDWKLNG